jgi:hypothetical protein
MQPSLAPTVLLITAFRKLVAKGAQAGSSRSTNRSRTPSQKVDRRRVDQVCGGTGAEENCVNRSMQCWKRGSRGGGHCGGGCISGGGGGWARAGGAACMAFGGLAGCRDYPLVTTCIPHDNSLWWCDDERPSPKRLGFVLRGDGQRQAPAASVRAHGNLG